MEKFSTVFSKFFLRKHIFKTGYIERDDSVFNSKVMSFKLSIKSPNILADCAMKIYHKSCQKSPKLVTRLHLQRLERIWGRIWFLRKIFNNVKQRILAYLLWKGKSHCMAGFLFDCFAYFKLTTRYLFGQIQTSATGGQPFIDTQPYKVSE